MRKGKSVIGKPVLSRADGRVLRNVKDVILGAENDSIAGLLVDEGGLLSSSVVVPIDQIASFGRDAVVVQSSESVVAADEAPTVKAILDRNQSLLGTRVYTESGDDQGKVSDVYFDETSGRVLGLEVSAGTMGDVTSGRHYLPVEDILGIGPDVLYVRPETAEALEAQRGGISGALAQAGERTRDAATSAREAVPGSSVRPEEQLIGRRTGRDVEDETGAVIVPAGRRVTTQDVERARAANRLPLLTASVAAGDAERARVAASDAVADAGDTAGDLWDRFTQKLGEVTDATGRRVDEEQTKRRLKQIEDAVGRPVTKVILDLDDRVILDLGDIITHTAIQRAHEAGALDSLLDSVYKGDVSFAKDEMRARRPGEANLEAAQASTDRPAIVEELRGRVDEAERQRQEDAEQRRQEQEAARQDRETQRHARRRDRETQAQAREQAQAQESETPRPVAVGPGPSNV